MSTISDFFRNLADHIEDELSAVATFCKRELKEIEWVHHIKDVVIKNIANEAFKDDMLALLGKYIETTHYETALPVSPVPVPASTEDKVQVIASEGYTDQVASVPV